MEHRRSALLSVWLVMGPLVLVLWPAGARAQAGRWEWQPALPQGHSLYGVWGSSDSPSYVPKNAALLEQCRRGRNSSPFKGAGDGFCRPGLRLPGDRKTPPPGLSSG